MFAVPVAEYRDQEAHGEKTKAVIDFTWSVWAGRFDEEFVELVIADMQSPAPAFLWHRYFTEGTKEMGVKHRAFVAACMPGPTSADPAANTASGVVMGTSELEEAEQEDLKKTKEVLMSLRRKTSRSWRCLRSAELLARTTALRSCRKRGSKCVSDIGLP